MSIIKVKLTRLISYLKNLGQKNRQFKKRLGYGLGILVLFLMAYYLLALLVVSPAEVNLLRLKEDTTYHKICHETCLLARTTLEKEIADELKKGGSSNLPSVLQKYFSDSSQDLNFRQEILKILSLARGTDNPPDYLKIYFNDSKNPVELRTKILELFSLNSLIKSETSGANLNKIEPLNVYFKLLEKEDNWLLQEKAIQAISSDHDKANNFTESQLLIIKRIVRDRSSAPRLRSALAMLLSDYYPFFPSLTREILELIYQDFSTDAISRYFAADILNRLEVGPASRLLPEISEEAWQNYYNY
ncbi:MAG: hypothetical protein WC863_02095 [Patescibacteria group bacterium]